MNRLHYFDETGSEKAVDLDTLVGGGFVHKAGGRATVGAATATKYICTNQTAADITAFAITSNSAGAPHLFYLVGALFALDGFTTNLRLIAAVENGTSPAITITPALYPVTVSSGNVTPGTIVTDSDAPVTPAGVGITLGDSGDFAAPADGPYVIGYEVSGTPAQPFTVQAQLFVSRVPA